MEPTMTWLHAILAEPRALVRRPTPPTERAPTRRLARDLRRAAGHALVELGHALAGDGRRAATIARR